MSGVIVPGCHVRHPLCRDWGLGQVQSVAGNRITVNFENAGKRVINGDVVALELIDDAPAPRGGGGGK
jgi:hypothetical protein